MTGDVLALAGVMFTAILGLVAAVIKLKPTQTDVTATNDGTWEKQGQGWERLNKAVEEHAAAAVASLNERVDLLEQKSRDDTVWRGLAVSYIRLLLGWGHDAGATDPPDPPHGLVIPDE